MATDQRKVRDRMDQLRLEQLNRKRASLRVCLLGLSYCQDDPRYPEAKAHYQGQLEEVDKELTELLGSPPPVTVSLQTAKMFGQSKLGE